jgi:hypothetical protein
MNVTAIRKYSSHKTVRNQNYACSPDALNLTRSPLEPIENGTDAKNKQDAANEPECSHVKHFCGTIFLNCLVHFSPVTVPVHCRLWNVEGGGMQSVECEECGELSGVCRV